MTSEEVVKAIRLAGEVEGLMKKAEAKEGILLDDHVETFRAADKIIQKLLFEVNELQGEALKDLKIIKEKSS